jgi:hypothetical protein
MYAARSPTSRVSLVCLVRPRNSSIRLTVESRIFEDYRFPSYLPSSLLLLRLSIYAIMKLTAGSPLIRIRISGACQVLSERDTKFDMTRRRHKSSHRLRYRCDPTQSDVMMWRVAHMLMRPSAPACVPTLLPLTALRQRERCRSPGSESTRICSAKTGESRSESAGASAGSARLPANQSGIEW